jgi:hypothetical protein
VQRLQLSLGAEYIPVCVQEVGEMKLASALRHGERASTIFTQMMFVLMCLPHTVHGPLLPCTSRLQSLRRKSSSSIFIPSRC